jgi:hypothetical protein
MRAAPPVAGEGAEKSAPYNPFVRQDNTGTPESKEEAWQPITIRKCWITGLF